MTQPIIWYDFANVHGSTVKNSSSNDHDGTIYHNAKYGHSGSPAGGDSLNLYNRPVNNSVNDSGQYMSIPPFQFGGPITVTFWFKKNVKDEPSATIFDFFDSDTGRITNEFVAFFNKKGNITIGNRDKNGISKILLNQDYCDDKWYHFAIVHDGTTMTVYINGNKKDSVKSTAIENIASRGSQMQSMYSTMSIEDFRVYNKNLTENDIHDIFTTKKNNTKTSNKNNNKIQSLKDLYKEHYNKNKKTTIAVTVIVGLVVLAILIGLGFLIKKKFFSG